MTVTELQCVYFFKQFQKDGTYLVKIGMSKNKSPESRFTALKTYSPYGCELLGFIMTKNALKLESDLHKRFANLRLNGEWFYLEESKCHSLIKHYNKPQQHFIKKMFAEFLSKELNGDCSIENNIENIIDSTSLKTKDKIENILKIDKKFSKTELAKKLNISRRMVYKHIKNIKNPL